MAFKNIGIDDWEKFVEIDKNLFRPAEVDLLLGDSTKAKNILGWEPTLNFEQLIQLMVNSDLNLYKPR